MSTCRSLCSGERFAQWAYPLYIIGFSQRCAPQTRVCSHLVRRSKTAAADLACSVIVPCAAQRRHGTGTIIVPLRPNIKFQHSQIQSRRRRSEAVSGRRIDNRLPRKKNSRHTRLGPMFWFRDRCTQSSSLYLHGAGQLCFCCWGFVRASE